MDVIGIDISKAKLDVFDPQRRKSMTVGHDQAGVDRLLHWLDGRKPLIVVEATGGYERRLMELLAGRMDVAVANPARIRALAIAGGQMAKTDRLDARIIATFGVWAKLRPTIPPDSQRQALIEILAYRRAAQNELVRRRQQLAHITDPDLRARAIDAIDRRAIDIEALNKLIRDKIQAVQALRQNFEILTSMPRIGLVGAATILAHLPEIGTLNSKQIASLAGLAPFAKDSGTQTGKRPIRGGRIEIRNALYMAAIGTAKLDNRFGIAFRTMQKRNKPGKVIAVAIMRKMLTILNAMIKAGSLWQEQMLGQETST